MITWRELVELYRIHDQPVLYLRPRYNVAPTQEIPICRHGAKGREFWCVGGSQALCGRYDGLPYLQSRGSVKNDNPALIEPVGA